MNKKTRVLMNTKKKDERNEKSRECYEKVLKYETKSWFRKKLHRDMSSALSKSLNDLGKFASKSYLKKMKNKTLSKMNRDMFSLETIPRKFLKKCKFCNPSHVFKKELCTAWVALVTPVVS